MNVISIVPSFVVGMRVSKKRNTAKSKNLMIQIHPNVISLMTRHSWEKRKSSESDYIHLSIDIHLILKF